MVKKKPLILRMTTKMMARKSKKRPIFSTNINTTVTNSEPLILTTYMAMNLNGYW
jgi:hypothetical protein